VSVKVATTVLTGTPSVATTGAAATRSGIWATLAVLLAVVVLPSSFDAAARDGTGPDDENRDLDHNRVGSCSPGWPSP
jgi:hypothetical protein